MKSLKAISIIFLFSMAHFVNMMKIYTVISIFGKRNRKATQWQWCSLLIFTKKVDLFGKVMLLACAVPTVIIDEIWQARSCRTLHSKTPGGVPKYHPGHGQGSYSHVFI